MPIFGSSMEPTLQSGGLLTIDPVEPQDIRGTVGSQIPALGLPLLFFQSQQGVIFIIIALALLAFFLYGGEITRGGKLVHRGIFAPVIKRRKTRQPGADTQNRSHGTEDE